MCIVEIQTDHLELASAISRRLRIDGFQVGAINPSPPETFVLEWGAYALWYENMGLIHALSPLMPPSLRVEELFSHRLRLGLSEDQIDTYLQAVGSPSSSRNSSRWHRQA